MFIICAFYLFIKLNKLLGQTPQRFSRPVRFWKLSYFPRVNLSLQTPAWYWSSLPHGKYRPLPCRCFICFYQTNKCEFYHFLFPLVNRAVKGISIIPLWTTVMTLSWVLGPTEVGNLTASCLVLTLLVSLSSFQVNRLLSSCLRL